MTKEQARYSSLSKQKSEVSDERPKIEQAKRLKTPAFDVDKDEDENEVSRKELQVSLKIQDSSLELPY